MHPGWNARLKTVLDIVVNAQTGFDQVLEVTDDLICIFVVKPLQFGDIFEFVEIFLEFRIEVKEHFQVEPQCLQKFHLRDLVSIGSSLLHLLELLTQSLVELRHLLLVVFGKVCLLLLDDIGHF